MRTGKDTILLPWDTTSYSQGLHADIAHSGLYADIGHLGLRTEKGHLVFMHALDILDILDVNNTNMTTRRH